MTATRAANTCTTAIMLPVLCVFLYSSPASGARPLPGAQRLRQPLVATANTEFLRASSAPWADETPTFTTPISSNYHEDSFDPTDSLLQELSTLTTTLNKPNLTQSESDQAADRAIEVRDTLIKSAPTHAHSVAWLADQSAALLDRLARDGSDSSVLAGLPTAAQREKVREQSLKAAALAVDSTAKFQAESARLRAAIQSGGAGVDAARERLEQVEEIELAVRLPLLRGRALSLAACTLSGPEAAKAADDAIATLSAVDAPSAGGEGFRRATLGLTLIRAVAIDSANKPWPAADDRAKRAAKVLQSVVELPLSDDPAQGCSRLSHAEARLGLLLAAAPGEPTRAAAAAIREALTKPPFIENRRADPLLIALAAEANARALLRDQPTNPAERAAWLAAAIAPLADLLNRDELGLGEQARRALVFEKLAAATENIPADVPLPPIAQLGKSLVLARQKDKAGEAISGLALVAKDAAVDAPLRADALWQAAVIGTESTDLALRASGLKALATLAVEQPNSRYGKQAAGAAPGLAATLAADFENAPDKKAGPWTLASIRELQGQILEIAILRIPEDKRLNPWRCDLAGLTLISKADALTAAELAAMVATLDPIKPTAASYQRADTILSAAAQTVIRTARARCDRAPSSTDPDAKAARKDWEQAARIAVTWAEPRSADKADAYRAELAEVLGLNGDKNALPLYRDLIARKVGDKIEGGEARLRLGHGIAQRASGDPASAFTTLKDLTEALDSGATGTSTRPREYWLAWAELLEIMQAGNADGKRSPEILLRIKELALLDPALGLPAAAARIDAVQAACK